MAVNLGTVILAAGCALVPGIALVRILFAEGASFTVRPFALAWALAGA